jgi:hypothetical protein
MKKLFALLVVLMLNINCSSDSDSSTPACTPIPCLNGGTSNANCGCNCPQGFTGANCGTLVTPTSVKITKIKVKKFPDVKTNGNWWDILPNSDADIYLTVENSAFTVIYNHPTYFTNATGLGTSTYDFIPATPINLTNVSSAYIINLYDYDGSTNNANNDFITLLAFTPFLTSQTSFPTTKTVTNSTNTFECELTYQYTW